MSDEVIENQGGMDDAMRALEADELAAAMAGYSGQSTRAQAAPVEPHEQATEEAQRVSINPEPDPEPTAQQSLAEQLEALKAQVHALKGQGDPDSVRRLHGEIGNINRTLKELKDAQPKPEPVKDELTAAIEDAEKVAAEFPEIAGPLANAMKLLKDKVGQPAQVQEPIDIESRVITITEQRLQRTAMEQLAEEHPDYETVRDTPEFKAWEATKTPEFRERLHTTWNPAVVSKALSEFKESLKTKQRKQERLAAAVVTPGTSMQAKPSTLPDEQGYFNGYNKGPKRLNSR